MVAPHGLSAKKLRKARKARMKAEGGNDEIREGRLIQV
jgi:hypothetical protein